MLSSRVKRQQFLVKCERVAEILNDDVQSLWTAYQELKAELELHAIEEDSNFDPTAFGQAVKQFRLKNELTMRDLAAQTKISIATISRVEDGKEPKVSTYFALRKAMKADRTPVK